MDLCSFSPQALAQKQAGDAQQKKGILRKDPNDLVPQMKIVRAKSIDGLAEIVGNACTNKTTRRPTPTRGFGGQTKETEAEKNAEEERKAKERKTVVAFGRTTLVEDTIPAAGKNALSKKTIPGSAKDVSELKKIVEDQMVVINELKEELEFLKGKNKKMEQNYDELLDMIDNQSAKILKLERGKEDSNVQPKPELQNLPFDSIALKKTDKKQRMAFLNETVAEADPCNHVAEPRVNLNKSLQILPQKNSSNSSDKDPIDDSLLKNPNFVKSFNNLLKEYTKQDKDREHHDRDRGHHRDDRIEPRVRERDHRDRRDNRGNYEDKPLSTIVEKKEHRREYDYGGRHRDGRRNVGRVRESVTVHREFCMSPSGVFSTTIDDVLGQGHHYPRPVERNHRDHHRHQQDLNTTPRIQEMSSGEELSGAENEPPKSRIHHQKDHKHDETAYEHQRVTRAETRNASGNDIQFTVMKDNFEDDFDEDSRQPNTPKRDPPYRARVSDRFDRTRKR